MIFSWPIFLLIGILPAILWLLFFLRKDVHPEPNSMVIKIFLFGMLSTLPTFFIEIGLFSYIYFWFGESPFFDILYLFLGVALVEESMKYLVVRDKVLKSPELDEPADLILYMIISALGFAAFENILFSFRAQVLERAILISFLRFWGAIFLHALCSGLFGYFLALSFFDRKREIKLKITGLGFATFLHGLFNFSIIKIGEIIEGIDGEITFLNFHFFLFYLFLILSILIGSAIFVHFGFKRLQRTKSICKIII